MLADVEADRLVVLGGTDAARAPAANKSLGVAVYDIGNAAWETFEIAHVGIGTPTLGFIHDDTIGLLTAHPAELVTIDLGKRTVVTASRCPDGAAFSLGVLIGDVLFACRDEDHDLWRCELGQREWRKIGQLAASRANHRSVLFTDGRRLLSWSAREPGARNDTAVWEIDQDTGGETMIHRAIPGPAARAASSTCVGDGKLFVCGGQGSKGGWLTDVWGYDIATGQRFRDLDKLPDAKLDWAVDALGDGRITERWVWEVLSQRPPSVIMDRLRGLPDGRRRHIRWRLLGPLMGDIDADIAFLHAVPPRDLLEEVADIWPQEIEPIAQDGAYHWTIRARSIAGPVVHDAVLLSIADHGTAGAKLVHFETVRERVYVFEQVPPRLGIYTCGVLNRGRVMYSADTGRGGGFDSRGFGHVIPKGMKLPVIDAPEDFSQNAVPMPIEVQRLVPEPY